MYMQFGCFACEEIIHVSDQPVAPSFGRNPGCDGIERRLAVSLQREVLVLPRGADLVVAVGECRDLLRRIRPVLADVRLLLLEQIDGRVELIVVGS